MCDIQALSNSGIEKDIRSFVGVQQSPRFNIDIIHYENGHAEISFSKNDKRGYEKVILCFQKPVNIIEFQICREHVIDHGASEIKAFIYDESVEEVKEKISKECTKWCKEPPREDNAFKIKSYVDLSKKADKDSPSHLYASAMFGKMGDLLLQLRIIAHKYVEAIKSITFADRYGKICNAVKGEKNSNDGNKDDTLSLPKILLLGDSGVGKSLITNFLHECLLKYLKNAKIKLPEEVHPDPHHPLRVAIPEFLDKEDDFEYRLFGYVRGAYTGANANGDCGLLAQNIGQVVFLDEIGTASPKIQAKLLAYLDDYKIRPRGWQQAPLVVAATNEKERIYDTSQFRTDLLARFTNILQIPNLKERIAGNEEVFKYILDCVVQNDNKEITSIGEGAWEVLWNHFSQGCSGNFRELENWIREACRNAMDDKRKQLIAKDFESLCQQERVKFSEDALSCAPEISVQVRKNSTWHGRENVILDEIKQHPQWSADKIYEDLQGKGHNGSRSSVRRFVAKCRNTMKTKG